MSHRLAVLLAAAGLALGLAACDNPAAGILSSAKMGDCYTVTGKDAMGQPKLMRSDCPVGQTPGQSSLPAVAAEQPSTASVQTAAQAPVCQPVAPACVVPASPVVQRSKAASRRVVRKVRRQVHVASTIGSEYLGAYVPSASEFAAGVAGREVYQSTEQYAYAPPPPPPLPPPPLPPPPVVRDYAERSQQFQSRSSQSYSAESHGSDSRAYVVSTPPRLPPRPCNCVVRPRYEPDGYLTWPGKTPF